MKRTCAALLVLIVLSSCSLFRPRTGTLPSTIDFAGFRKHQAKLQHSPTARSFSTCIMNDLRYLEPQNYKRADLLNEIYSFCDDSPALGQLLYLVDLEPTTTDVPRVIAVVRVTEADRGDGSPYMTRFKVVHGDAVAVLGFGQFRSRLLFVSEAAARNVTAR